MPGFFDNGPYPVGQIPKEPSLPPAPEKPRRNTVRILATRVCDGEVFEFLGWAEVERLGFDRLQIVDSIMAVNNGNGRNYLKACRPVAGFTWRLVEPQTHPAPSDTYYSPF